MQAEKEFLSAIEKFKTKFNNEEISNAIDELRESFTKYESVVWREAFIVGVGFGMRMGWLSTHQIKISFLFLSVYQIFITADADVYCYVYRKDVVIQFARDFISQNCTNFIFGKWIFCKSSELTMPLILIVNSQFILCTFDTCGVISCYEKSRNFCVFWCCQSAVSKNAI